jgi:hypothetical protein
MTAAGGREEATMRKPIAAVLCVAALGLMASVPLAVAQQKSAKAEPTQGRSLSTIRDLMDSIVDPSADVVWGAVGSVVDQDGVHDNFPKTQEEWLNVRRAAIRIIEGSNLLMMPGRDAAPPGSKSEAPGVELEPPEITALIKKNRRSFDAFARTLQALGLEAVRAIEAQDTKALLEIGGQMQDACEGCHQVFWYPGAKQPKPVQQPRK